ncbi:FMRFamide receptor-like isoform X2 [Lineus longissimus]|uniref:FMRFamide receptor-like isoform X2 n=1 Tax=Lineus longissimus TaxID=88925 RepID=UPI00315DABFD
MESIWNISQKGVGDINSSGHDINGTLLNGMRLLESHGEVHPNQGFYDKAQFVTGLICYPIVCIFGITGNLISIIVISHGKLLNSTNIYLAALAVSDTIKLMNDFCYFLVILLLRVDPPMGELGYAYLYPYAHFIFNATACVTAWLTVSVAVERYILVCRPARAKHLCTIRRARINTTLVFIAMSMLCVPFALRYETITRTSNTTNETALDVEVTSLWRNKTFETVYTWGQNLIRSVIPLLVLCVLNFLIIHAVRRTRARKTVFSRHRITIMLLCVIIVFLLCITPDAIMSTVFGFGYYEENYLVRGVREFTDFLLLVNSAVNFILYCIFNTLFRKQFMVLFCNRCARDRIQIHESRCGKVSFSLRTPSVANNGFRKLSSINGASKIYK